MSFDDWWANVEHDLGKKADDKARAIALFAWETSARERGAEIKELRAALDVAEELRDELSRFGDGKEAEE